MNRNGYVVLSLIFITTLFSCSNKPGNLIPKDEMIALMVDMNLARAIYNNNNSFRSDSIAESLIQSVLDKHEISQADLDSSLIWYADDMKTYMEISDSVTSLLRKRYEVANAELTKANLEMHQSDFLTTRIIRLDSSAPNFSFNIDSTNFALIKKDYFVWSFTVKGIAPAENLLAGIYFKYKDSLVYQSTELYNNKLYKFSKPDLPDSLLQSISGYIHLRTDNKTQFYPPVLIHNLNYTDSVSVQKTDSLKREDSQFDSDSILKKLERPKSISR